MKKGFIVALICLVVVFVLGFAGVCYTAKLNKNFFDNLDQMGLVALFQDQKIITIKDKKMNEGFLSSKAEFKFDIESLGLYDIRAELDFSNNPLATYQLIAKVYYPQELRFEKLENTLFGTLYTSISLNSKAKNTFIFENVDINEQDLALKFKLEDVSFSFHTDETKLYDTAFSLKSVLIQDDDDELKLEDIKVENTFHQALLFSELHEFAKFYEDTRYSYDPNPSLDKFELFLEKILNTSTNQTQIKNISFLAKEYYGPYMFKLEDLKFGYTPKDNKLETMYLDFARFVFKERASNIQLDNFKAKSIYKDGFNPKKIFFAASHNVSLDKLEAFDFVLKELKLNEDDTINDNNFAGKFNLNIDSIHIPQTLLNQKLDFHSFNLGLEYKNIAVKESEEFLYRSSSLEPEEVIAKILEQKPELEVKALNFKRGNKSFDNTLWVQFYSFESDFAYDLKFESLVDGTLSEFFSSPFFAEYDDYFIKNEEGRNSLRIEFSQKDNQSFKVNGKDFNPFLGFDTYDESDIFLDNE